MSSLSWFFILGASFLLLFAVGEILYHVLKIRVEYTRKFVHFGTGILTLFFPILLGKVWMVFALCASFAVILWISLRYDYLKSINKIDRASHGSISYPAAVFITYAYYDFFGDILFPLEKTSPYLLFYLPVLLLAVCDPVAALVGKSWPWIKYKVGDGHKTISGTIGFFVAAVALTVLLMMSLCNVSFATAIVSALPVALIATLAEAFSRKGLDNLFIPLAAIIALQIVEGRLNLLHSSF